MKMCHLRFCNNFLFVFLFSESGGTRQATFAAQGAVSSRASVPSAAVGPAQTRISRCWSTTAAAAARRQSASSSAAAPATAKPIPTCTCAFADVTSFPIRVFLGFRVQRHGQPLRNAGQRTGFHLRVR